MPERPQRQRQRNMLLRRTAEAFGELSLDPEKSRCEFLALRGPTGSPRPEQFVLVGEIQVVTPRVA